MPCSGRFQVPGRNLHPVIDGCQAIDFRIADATPVIAVAFDEMLDAEFVTGQMDGNERRDTDQLDPESDQSHWRMLTPKQLFPAYR